MEGLKWLWKGTKVMFYAVSPWELALGNDDPAPLYLLKYGLPMFFVMITLERLAFFFRDNVMKSKASASKGVLRPLSSYRLNDFLASITSGSFQLIGLLTVELIGIGVEKHSYTFVYNHFRLFTVDSKANVWLSYFVLMFGKDFGYYWAHRCMHEWHGMWVGHSVHHSGEDYNLGTALRQGFQQPLVGWPFYLPLALLGFNPKAFAAHSELNTLCMFWFHTDLIGRLPLGLEYILNSPASHRMHHRPPGNCNYAGTFIIWDRLFGTYVPEVVRRDYFGLAESPNTFDPFALNTNHIRRMAHNVNAVDMSSTSAAAAAAGGNGGNGGGGGVLASAALLVERALKRRVPARWVVQPWGLVAAIPELKADLRTQPPPSPSQPLDRKAADDSSSGSSSSSEADAGSSSASTVAGGGGGRPKWDGGAPMTLGWAVAATAAWLCLMGASIALLLLSSGVGGGSSGGGGGVQPLHGGDALLIAGAVLAGQSSLGRVLDQRFGAARDRSDGKTGGGAWLAASELAILLPVLAALFALRPAQKSGTAIFFS